MEKRLDVRLKNWLHELDVNVLCHVKVNSVSMEGGKSKESTLFFSFPLNFQYAFLSPSPFFSAS